MNSRRITLLCACALSLLVAAARGDVMDDGARLQTAWEEVLLDAYGNRPNDAHWQAAVHSSQAFSHVLGDSPARAAWLPDSDLEKAPAESEAAARLAGEALARLQHAYALAMLDAVAEGRVGEARQWRALIQLPRNASAVEGAIAMQQFAGQPAQRGPLSSMLSREVLGWQSTRIREKLDQLQRLLAEGRAPSVVLAGRVAEIRALAGLPAPLLAAANVGAAEPPAWGGADAFAAWREGVEDRLPNVLTAAEVERRERLLLKLLKLIPMEYRAGVRDGQIVVPFEYREAQVFTVQAAQLASELNTSWRTSRPEAYAGHRAALRDGLEAVETAIARREDVRDIERGCAVVAGILQEQFGVSLQRRGTKADVIAESVLDVRTALTGSLAAARAGRWGEAESLRLDAYTTFDTEIERRVLPRNAELALRAERAFLDGGAQAPGIKAVLDRRARGAELESAYTATLAQMDECVALLSVGLSPATVTFTTVTIVAREGLEAVVILAALLAGLRGPRAGGQRRNIWIGVWLSLVATAATFWLGRTLVQSLSGYGEQLEAVISVLAVCVLLLVTNWVFHKYYWVGWNAKLRDLRKAAEDTPPRWEGLALVGVGFLTIYREGFETTLFLQSLLLEGGLRPVLYGLAIGGGLIVLAGGAVFLIGLKLPYRRLLIVTGLLVVGILMTFIGSTVRLFQTVGWCTLHPIPGLVLPDWMGLWLGLYPSWEGLLIPPMGLLAVGAAWLWMKWRSRRAAAAAGVTAAEPALAG